MSRPVVLVIAGSDSSGGAGLEADQKVLAAHGVYAATATTALTAQNTLGVEDIHVVPPAFLRKQMDAVLGDIGADVVKIGMLALAETVDVVATTLSEHKESQLVLDPVMVATSGAQLLPSEAVRNLREKLLPLTTLLTPNVPEAQLLLQDAGQEAPEIQCLDDFRTLAKAVHQLGPSAVLLKGGHVPFREDYRKADRKSIVVDVLYDGNEYTTIETPYSPSNNTHGTGCSLASAIAAKLALGKTLKQAAREACRYVEAGIRTSKSMGKGNGPINHFHSLQPLPFAPGRFIEYLLQRSDVVEIWDDFMHHDFVERLADGTLERQIFQDYLVQDYLYLVQFARSNALASYKSKSIEAISKSAGIVLHIEREMSLHLEYCRSFGLSREDIEKHKESQACTAYSRYILDVGQSEDWLALQMALAPCLIGYGAIAKRLYAADSSLKAGNPYWKWVENYIADDYVEAVRKGSALIEENIQKQSPSRIEELVAIYIRSTEMEVNFWKFGAHSGVR